MLSYKRFFAYGCIFFSFFSFSSFASLSVQPDDFSVFVQHLKQEMLSNPAISSSIVELAFSHVVFLPRVISLDKNQPEFTKSFHAYMRTALDPLRVRLGRKHLYGMTSFLYDSYIFYGVPPQILVAFWGLETNYGTTMGSFSAISALSTLIYEGRRVDFFKRELVQLLLLMEQGDVPSDVLSSWAGALGNPQFMPSTYNTYAVRFSKTESRNLFYPDLILFFSMGNFLRKLGWDRTLPWGMEVVLPYDFDYDTIGLATVKTLEQWEALGVKPAAFFSFPRLYPARPIEASVLLPAGSSASAYLVFNNFRVILRWNNSPYYALAVGILSDTLLGTTTFEHRQDLDFTIDSATVRLVQQRLQDIGYYHHPVDGRFGQASRYALISYQRHHGLIPDGHLSPDMVSLLLSLPADTPSVLKDTQ